MGDNGPVQILTTSSTRFDSTKPIWLDERGIHLGPATTTARTCSTVTGIETSLPGLRGRIALRIAGGRVADSLGLSQKITADHVSRRVGRRFDKSVDDKLAEMGETFGKLVAELPADNPLRPRRWHVSSSEKMVQLVAIGNPSDSRRYVPAPTSLLGTADIEVDIYVTVVKDAIADAALKKAIRPAVVMLASLERAEPADCPAVCWSADGKWLSISWGGDAAHEPSVNLAAALGKLLR